MEALGGWEAATLVASSWPLVPRGGDTGGHAHCERKRRLQLRCSFFFVSDVEIFRIRKANDPTEKLFSTADWLSRRRSGAVSCVMCPNTDQRGEALQFSQLATLLTWNPNWVETNTIFFLWSSNVKFPMNFFLKKKKSKRIHNSRQSDLNLTLRDPVIPNPNA